MLDHFGIKCHRPEITVPFYVQCLAPLGILVVRRQPEFKAVTLQRPDTPTRLWIGEGDDDWKTKAGVLRSPKNQPAKLYTSGRLTRSVASRSRSGAVWRFASKGVMRPSPRYNSFYDHDC